MVAIDAVPGRLLETRELTAKIDALTSFLELVLEGRLRGIEDAQSGVHDLRANSVTTENGDFLLGRSGIGARRVGRGEGLIKR